MMKTMHPTQHLQARMGQRGINGAMVDLVLRHGRIDHDRHVLDRKEAQSLLQTLKREEQLLKKVVDKGGMVVVTEGNALITTYNYTCRGR